LRPTAWRVIKAFDRIEKAFDRIDRRKDNMAEPHSRVRNWATVAAFTLIIALTIADGVDQGFSVWDWLIIAAGVVFILQALSRLKERRPGTA
jgi:hypothetical protein